MDGDGSLEFLKTFRFGLGSNFRLACPKCDKTDTIYRLSDGTFECYGENCRKDTAIGGAKFSLISNTLLHQAHKPEAYLKAARYIYEKVTKNEKFFYSDINKVCEVESPTVAKIITSITYHALQPAYKTVTCGQPNNERCCVGSMDYIFKNKSNQEKFKIFFFCDLAITGTKETRVSRRIRAADFKVLSIRLAYYRENEPFDQVLRTHYCKGANLGNFFFYCPDDIFTNEYSGKKNKKIYSGFPAIFFRHRWREHDFEPQRAELYLTLEKQHLLLQLRKQNPSPKELGVFLCKYVLYRNISLQGTKQTDDDILKRLLTPISFDGIQIKKNMPPGKGVTIRDLKNLKLA